MTGGRLCFAIIEPGHSFAIFEPDQVLLFAITERSEGHGENLTITRVKRGHDHRRMTKIPVLRVPLRPLNKYLVIDGAMHWPLLPASNQLNLLLVKVWTS